MCLYGATTTKEIANSFLSAGYSIIADTHAFAQAYLLWVLGDTFWLLHYKVLPNKKRVSL